MAESAQLEPKPALPAVAISATFTAEPLRIPLEFWMQELGLDLQVEFAPYNQVFQSLLDPGSVFARNNAGVNILLLRPEDWSGEGSDRQTAGKSLEENVGQLVSALKSAPSRVPLIVVLCPSSPEFRRDMQKLTYFQRVRDLLTEGTRDLPSVHLLTSDHLQEFYPVPDYYDEFGHRAGHIPYTNTFFVALATLLARRIFAMRSAPYKVIALDCDNTLWKGICGEDGPENVVIDEERMALQRFMVEQREAGMVLCLCSRNNERDVLETFRAHPEMPLKLEHFVTWRINWEPKSQNLASLAQELDLGLDSFIFIDDDLKECAEVEANCPNVLALGLTEMTGGFGHFLRNIWAFDHWKVTDEDRRRSEMYSQQVERTKFEKTAIDLDTFLAGLKLEVLIEPMKPDQLPRVAQLTQRTNQMNFRGIRRSEAEIEALVHNGDAECLTVSVSDRFGSYGLVGVILFRKHDDGFDIDTFLLSCRALGRGVEHRMLARVAQIAGNRGLTIIDVPFVQSDRNQPALRFLESIADRMPEQRTDDGSAELFRFPVASLVKLNYRPAAETYEATASSESSSSKKKTARPFTAFAHIASDLSDPKTIEAYVQAKRNGHNGHAPVISLDAPETDTEKRVALIWAELLGVPSVGVHDNFFDLGGHSLLAVQLLSRIRQEFNVDLSLEVVYSGNLTVAELAKSIELYELGQLDEERYTELLAELEQMSDEQAAALLAQEEAAEQASHAHE